MVTGDTYRALMAPVFIASKLIGVELWTSDKLLQPMSYVLMGVMLFYNVCIGYTAYKNRNDPMEIMKSSVICGVAFQLIFKYFASLSNKSAIRGVYKVIEEEIYYRYTDGSRDELNIIEKTVRLMGSLWKLIIALYASTVFVFALWPLYVYYTTGQIVPVFMYEIPMTNVEEPLGYILNLIGHVGIYVMGMMGLFVADGAFFFVAVHSSTIVDLFILHMNELEKILRMDETEDKNDQIAEKWKRCLQDHQLVTEFLCNIEGAASLMNLIHVFSCVFSVCDSMLLLALTDYYAAFCLLGVIFGDMSIYFIFGNVVELKIDEMYRRITDLPWFLLSSKQQKEFSYMLHRSQHPLMLTLYGFVPMNFETYMSVLRSLYQFFVLIMQYVE